MFFGLGGACRIMFGLSSMFISICAPGLAAFFLGYVWYQASIFGVEEEERHKMIDEIKQKRIEAKRAKRRKAN